jgi:hypothetical protein
MRISPCCPAGTSCEPVSIVDQAQIDVGQRHADAAGLLQPACRLAITAIWASVRE